MADSGSCVRGSLLQLQESLSAADRCGVAVASGQLLRGLGQECVLSSGPALLGGYSSGLRTAGSSPSGHPGWCLNGSVGICDLCKTVCQLPLFLTPEERYFKA